MTRSRGRKRSPFDEAECGHHYARAMSAWAEVLAMSGFHYDRGTQTLSLTEQAQPMAFACGSGWGTWRTENRDGKLTAIINLHEGTMPFLRVLIGDVEVGFERVQ